MITLSVWIPVVVAVVTGLLAVLGQKVIADAKNKELYAKLDKDSELSDQKIQGQIDVIKTEIKTLSDRVNVHNNLIDRMYKVEADVQELKHDAERRTQNEH